MMEITGKYGKALVFSDQIDDIAREQIENLLNSVTAEGARIRIMPDVHAGAGCVIGYTSTLTERIIPNLIGVDIGCGVCAWNLGTEQPDYKKLDDFIRKAIPHGFNVRETLFDARKLFPPLQTAAFSSYEGFLDAVRRTCTTQDQDTDYTLRSLGTLGGGNHFIEIDRDDDGHYWLLVHSGSRNFGLKVALFHQTKAESIAKTRADKSAEDSKQRVKQLIADAKARGETSKIQEIIAGARTNTKKGSWKKTGLEFLEDGDKESYIRDMQVAQVYAQLNRRIMGYQIIEFLGKDYAELELAESVHNYINFNDGIIRKGAISAHEGEKVIIPLNMADGTVFGTGRGNEEWNHSAPHGAGRVMSRKQARKHLSLDEYKERMSNVWTSCVSEATLDEAPGVYKSAAEIITYLEPAVTVLSRAVPVYNFKSDTPDDGAD